MKFGSLYAFATSASLVLLTAPTGFANGRFPRAQRVAEAPGQPEKLVIVGTYGLLVTEDRGKHWSYVCDAAFTFQTTFASDALLGLTADGSLLIGVQKSLTLSHDRGCDFVKVLEPPGSASIDDFTISPSNGNEVLALVTTFEGGANTIRLQESMDGGQTWQVIGAPLPAALVYTLDVDPQNSSHLYATATDLSSDDKAPALFLTSSDRGASWTVGTIPNTTLDSSPWIAAIHPRDGNKVFVRTDSWKKNSAHQQVAGDALLYSDDGGKTWTELLHAGGNDPQLAGAKMLGFALSPDGSTALVGYGDIVDATRIVDPDGKWLGIYKSSEDGKYSFGAGAPADPVPLLKVPVTCLSWTQQGIYGCFAPRGESHSLAFTTDPNFTPASLSTLMKANEVEGVSRCCKGRALNACTWSNDCAALGACDAGAPTDAGTCGGAGGGGGAPTMDAGPDSGKSDANGGSAGAGGGSGGTGGTSNGDGKGCGCRMAGSRTVFDRSTAALLVAALLGKARRRRRSLLQ